MVILKIVRGLPGSGKSTYAKKLIEYDHFEADMFFDSSLGYRFESNFIGLAHDWCFTNVIKSLRDGKNVVVTNTFTQLWEMDRYLAIPISIPDVKIEIVELKTQYGNIHSVPEDKLKKMSSRWEDIPEDWEISLVKIGE